MPSILVCGATGKQGGAVINALLATGRSDLSVQALTRNPASAAATALLERDIHPLKGDFDDRQSILSALEGIGTAYLVTDFTGQAKGTSEVQQGRLFVDCAKKQGVSHIVYSSVAGAKEAEKVEHFHSKHIIEQAIRDSGLNWTFVRPTNFLENTPPPGLGRFFFFGFMSAIFGQDKIYHIAVEDIGKVAAKAIMEPEKFRNRIVHTVGQIATADEFQAAVDRAEGFKSWRMWFPRWFVLAVLPNEFKHMFLWLSSTYSRNEMPGSVAELKEIAPDALDIEAWAKKQKTMRDMGAGKKLA